MAATPASEAQLRYLTALTAPEKLAALTSSEARHLIGFLSAPPSNMSRAQQCYAFDLLGKLDRGDVRRLIEGLVRLAGSAAAAPAVAPPARPAGGAVRRLSVAHDGDPGPTWGGGDHGPR